MKNYQSIQNARVLDCENEVDAVIIHQTRDWSNQEFSTQSGPNRRLVDLAMGFVVGTMFAFVSAIYFGNNSSAQLHSKRELSNLNLQELAESDEKTNPKVSLGVRPFFLVDQMPANHPLKQRLKTCAEQITEYKPSDFAIGHRGASLQFPEHTFRSHTAASRMGAGIVECDVTFTKDEQLVCRHSQCDLHRTTDVLLRPDLASKCRVPFVPSYQSAHGTHVKAKAYCCTTDFTLKEIQSLCGTMDAANEYATNAEQYVMADPGLPHFRTDLYSHDCPKIPTHQEYIANVNSHGGKFTPELKVPDADTPMPFSQNYTREMYATQMIQDYIDLGIPPDRVFPQAFDWTDLYFWAESFPAYAIQGFALDSLDDMSVLSSRSELMDRFQPLLDNGIRTIAPAIWMLITTDENSKIVPSLYAQVAKEMGLDIVAYTLERSDSLALAPGYFYQSVANEVTNDSDIFTVLDVLAQQVKIKGIFSDWAATVTFYANCFGL